MLPSSRLALRHSVLQLGCGHSRWLVVWYLLRLAVLHLGIRRLLAGGLLFWLVGWDGGVGNWGWDMQHLRYPDLSVHFHGPALTLQGGFCASVPTCLQAALV